jgi:ubiquitin-conjugating enzyme E2 W
MSGLPAKAIKRVNAEHHKFEAEKTAEDGLTLEIKSEDVWHVTFVGAPATVYAGEQYTLRIRFTPEYPFDSPEVVFLGPSPEHCHIYSNGHICLNILGTDWTPALTVRSIVMSILSMMSSATRKERPEDDVRYCRVPRASPKTTSFFYHDDKV